MNKTWLYTCLGIALILLGLLKSNDVKSLKTFVKAERTIKLKNFQDARSRVSPQDLELLKLWESILTGRSAPLSKHLKEHYKKLGLNHIFTPSGFHLSAVLYPFMRLIKNTQFQLLILILMGSLMMFLPGMGALKRMILVKGSQKVMGLKAGFVGALLIDVLFGTFQNSPLSFTYSFLFLSIIYSGAKNLGLVVWFYIGQMILSFFQDNDISPLLLLFSPILNFGFSMVMPLLFLLSIPLWGWQLKLGIFLLRIMQESVEHLSTLSSKFPSIEMHVFILLMLLLIVFRKKHLFLLSVLVTCNSLNLDRTRTPSLPSKEFIPQGEIVATYYREKDVRVLFSDGSCNLRLIRGYWWENCSTTRKRGNSSLR